MNTVEMFNKLASTYDRNTAIISFGIENFWRKKFCKKTITFIKDNESYLDIASATGETVKEILKYKSFNKIYALEPSKNMINIAKTKVNAIFLENIAEDIPLNDESVDFITIFMGIRNFEDKIKASNEIKRVLKKDGIVAIMELTKPDKFSLIYILSNFYMNKIVPILGGILSGGQFSSYKEFPKSINKITDNDIKEYFTGLNLKYYERDFFNLASIFIYEK